ncbi:MAG: type II secretion system protein GspM [Gammaproteobacteria bacterium]
MKHYAQQLMQWFEARNERERLLIMVVSLAALVSLWLLMISDPQSLRREQLNAQYISQQAQQAALQAQLDAIMARAKKDPDQDNKARIERLQEDITVLNSTLQQRMHGFVDPARMASVLEDVLKQKSRMTLLSLQSLPAEVVLANAAANSNGEAPSTRAANLYRHGFRIELQGSYLDTLQYLTALEDLPWDFYWDAIDVEMEKYPQARIVLQLHTLSLKEGWIGV